MMPCTDRSNALASHELGEVPYSGLELVGVWFSENKEGIIGA